MTKQMDILSSDMAGFKLLMLINDGRWRKLYPVMSRSSSITFMWLEGLCCTLVVRLAREPTNVKLR